MEMLHLYLILADEQPSAFRKFNSEVQHLGYY